MNPYLTPYKKINSKWIIDLINSKWIIDLNVKAKTTYSFRSSEEGLQENIFAIRQRFLKKKVLTIKEENRKLFSIKIRTSAPQKTPLRKCKDKPQTERGH